MIKIKSLLEYQGVEEVFDFNTDLLDELIDLVGSEEEVEEAAELAYNDLVKKLDSNDFDMEEDEAPERLAVISLILKLIELNKLSPLDAEEILEKYLELND
jgi:hypothetical protein